MQQTLDDIVTKGMNFKGEVSTDEGLQLASKMRAMSASGPTSGVAALQDGSGVQAAPAVPQAGFQATQASADPAERDKFLKAAALARNKAEIEGQRKLKIEQDKAARQALKASSLGKGQASASPLCIYALTWSMPSAATQTMRSSSALERQRL